MRHQDGAPRTVNTIGVDDLEDAVQKVESAGGKVVVPKMPIPGVGWLVYCTDTEGMLFGIHKEDPTAA
jgi:predicted enzyme related to lactoylglutathione lyase